MAAAPDEERQLDLVVRIRIAVARLNRQLRQQAGDLSPTLQSALVSIERHGPITLGDLAAVEQIAPATVTKIVTRLADERLVERTVDASDRRVAKVVLTPAGTARLAESRNRRTAYLATRLREPDAPSEERLRIAAEVLEALAAPTGDRP
jgi:DNA-binding MarR family transcriptional regulator